MTDTTLKARMILLPDVHHVWSDVEPHLTKAVDKSGGRYTLASVLNDIFMGKVTLWVVTDDEKIIGTWTIRIMVFPHRKTICGELLGGERLNEWLELLHETTVSYGKQFSCTHVELGGRPGWEKVSKKLGYTKAYTMLEQEI